VITRGYCVQILLLNENTRAEVPICAGEDGANSHCQRQIGGHTKPTDRGEQVAIWTCDSNPLPELASHHAVGCRGPHSALASEARPDHETGLILPRSKGTGASCIALPMATAGDRE